MIENLLGIDSDFIIIGMLAVLIIFLILIIVIMTRLGRLKNKYEQFMRGKDGKSLEENLIFRLDQIDELIEANAANERNIDAIFRKMKFNFQKYSLVNTTPSMRWAENSVFLWRCSTRKTMVISSMQCTAEKAATRM